ncbi:3-isopropylmalate dehydrogenase [candidate division MSBL1 archaeon SCGC-AAA833F18]|uniref:3-isopropylmalate dehydrogenase n=2 Tax=candidate division MSBL1 TaxID=215777 RepID=A0A133VTC4_9EURY|nr:3-isopropylmalate dehydrogenase [candidate division MSBL1 archaeon SCGC-AAA261F17]KXB09660.1 3-isopropylmalate dehydrogenase [candidate division MSBL1 archaeon SCGC-AAA833F18]
MNHKIAVIPGDGIGPEVIREGVKVLNAIEDSTQGLSFDLEEFPYGSNHYLETEELIPEEGFKRLEEKDAIYLGALGDPRVETGILEQGILLNLRFHFDQYINLRPVKLYPGTPCPLREKGPEDVNFYVVRENTEDFYVALGGRGKGRTSQELELKRSLYEVKFDLDLKADRDEIAYQIGVISRKGAERAIKFAFELAKRKNRKRLTSVDKANVLSHAYGFWREVFEEVAENYPEIETEFAFVDAITMWFVKSPEWYEVVVTPNMFGDIITDLGAMIQGGLGLAPGGNINPDGVSMFEPIHGSAPKHAGKNKANPLATILAGQMMLEELGEQKAADLIEQAVIGVLKEGKVRTYDLDGDSSTSDVGDAVAEKIGEIA